MFNVLPALRIKLIDYGIEIICRLNFARNCLTAQESELWDHANNAKEKFEEAQRVGAKSEDLELIRNLAILTDSYLEAMERDNVIYHDHPPEVHRTG